MRFWAVSIVLAGCGRLAFDPLATDDGSPTGPSGCPTLPASDNVTISGTTFRYTNFTTGMTPVDQTPVIATELGVQNLATATSNINGLYSMSFSQTGVTKPVYLTYNRATYLVTRVFLDGPISGDLIGDGGELWNPGDGPLWTSTQMDQIYGAAGVARVGTSGAINVGVRDCANQPLAGVEVVFDPPPGAIRYQDDTGQPIMQGSTGARFGHAFALNPELGMQTHITAVKDGYRFTEATFTVSDATNNLVLLHGGP